MASFEDILYGILASTAFWTILGLPIAERIAPNIRPVYLAPALGWSIYSALALPLFSVLGLSSLVVLIVNALLAICALGLLWLQRNSTTRRALSASEAACLTGAALLALVPMAAILPKALPDGIGLAWPIFDHAKIAMIDEMIRSGVPALNPFFHEAGGTEKLVYYYLWHFSAAVLGSGINLSGWEADAALTWFTAFASLTMMMGFATGLSGRAASAFWVVVLAATGSIRPILDFAIGADTAQALVGTQTGLGGWLFQSTWAPQHAASAMAVVLAVFLLTKLAEQQTAILTIAFALVSAAGFQSSVWVGGIVFILSAVAIALFLTIKQGARQRRHFALALTVAAGLCIALVGPFIIDQAASAAARGEQFPLAIEPLWVFGAAFPHTAGAILNLPAYWTLYLSAELPAYYPAGAIAVIMMLRRRWFAENQAALAYAFVALTIVALATAWLAVSAIGSNNDLGWRALLPAVFLLIVFAAAGLSRWVEVRTWRPCVLAACGILCGLPSAIILAHDNYVGKTPQSTHDFAASETMWQAVRRNADPSERVLNNPLFASDMTPWPANISWALLADRRSCYAGSELALPFAPISTERRNQIDTLIVRLFDGTATTADIGQIADRFQCDLLIITPQDGAWASNPFAQIDIYRLIDERPGTWRIYKRAR